MQTIRELCSFENRLTGTDAERRAANHLAERLRAAGRRVDVESIYVHPQMPLVQAFHCALAFAGSLVSIASPVAGFAMVLVAATSMYFDLNARLYIFRRLFFRRTSQNVVSRGTRPDAPARLIITAHVDAARTSGSFNPRRVRFAKRLDDLLPFPFGPFRYLFWSAAILVPILGFRLAGADSNGVSVLQLPFTLILLIGMFALVEVQVSKVVPAANDNASGVATALALAGALDAEPPERLDVWVLLTGGEESLMEGMHGFLRRHRKALQKDSTYFLNLDSVGGGEVRFIASEGLAVSVNSDQRLIQLCDAIAVADRENGNRYGAEELRTGFATDSFPASLAGYPATTITCLEHGALLPPRYHLPSDMPDAVSTESLDRAEGFALELVRALDRDLARRDA
jgi:Peptidase family M28